MLKSNRELVLSLGPDQSLINVTRERQSRVQIHHSRETSPEQNWTTKLNTDDVDRFKTHVYSYYNLFRQRQRKLEMAQRLRVHTALTEDSSSAPSIHVKGLRTTCNSSSREIFGHCTHVHLTPKHTYTHAHKHTQRLSHTIKK